MNPLAYILGIPVIAAVILTGVSSYKASARLNVLASALAFIASLGLLYVRPAVTPFFLIDDLNAYLLILTAFVVFTTSIFSVRYIQHELDDGRLQKRSVRFYHPMYQAFSFTMLLALATNNLGVLWAALEGATLTSVLLIGLYRTNEALGASWKYFILCGVGIGLALFGTTLLYFAAQPFMGEGLAAMTFTALLDHVKDFSPAILNLAFIFLLVGYATKAGLVPLHGWLPDAHSEGPTPISALLSGLLLNVALYGILRFKMLLAGTASAFLSGPLLIGFGLLSLLVASVMLYRRRDIKQLFAYSSIEHMGIAAFAFGIGGPLANFAGLLHLAMHSLTKSGIFFAVGHIAQVKHTQKIADIRGLTSSQPLLGWALVIGMVAIAGLPPFGVFMSEFLVATSTFATHPWLAALFILGLLLSFGALMMKLQGMAFGHGEGGEKVSFCALLPFFVHLALVLAAGICLPGALVTWFQSAAKLLG